ncbi:hypothetical protein [Candidatus Hakubella thermalkaliphila]|nr:hypothetical protein [Candidatus Hakubella thermalkaliphila]
MPENLLNLFRGVSNIAGYYKGLLEDVAMVKELFKAARSFIEKIG